MSLADWLASCLPAWLAAWLPACLARWLAACLPACLPGCAPPPTAPMMHAAFFPVLYRSSAFGLMKPSSYFCPFFR